MISAVPLMSDVIIVDNRFGSYFKLDLVVACRIREVEGTGTVVLLKTVLLKPKRG